MKPVEAGQQQSFASRWAEVAGSSRMKSLVMLSQSRYLQHPLVIGPSLLVPGKPLEPLTAFGNVTPPYAGTEYTVKAEKKQRVRKRKK